MLVNDERRMLIKIKVHEQQISKHKNVKDNVHTYRGHSKHKKHDKHKYYNADIVVISISIIIIIKINIIINSNLLDDHRINLHFIKKKRC